jgi:hypothetical protein
VHKLAAVLLLCAASAVPMWAAGQIMTVTSSSSFTLRGVPLNPAQGVPEWPVMPGDTIIAGTSPVKVTFPDGSTITLDPGSQAVISMQGATPVFQLVKGSADYFMKTLDSVRILTGNKAVELTHLAGSLKLPVGVLGVHPVATMVGSSVATGLGVGLAKSTSGGSSVSPSH